MKILSAKTENDVICVEYEILGETHKIGFPIENTKEEIEQHLLKLEDGRIKRAELQEEHKERFAKEAAAEETCKSLLK